MKSDRVILVFSASILCILAFALIAVLSQHALFLRTSHTNTSPVAISTPEISWEKYVDDRLGISFEYPQGWRAESLEIIPPPAEQHVDYMGAVTNAISFYSSNQLMHLPIVIPSEDGDLLTTYFSSLKQYINAPGTPSKNFRVISTDDSPADPNHVNRVGLYQDGDRMVGIERPDCYATYSSELDRQQKLAACDEIFRHILYSIHFLK